MPATMFGMCLFRLRSPPQPASIVQASPDYPAEQTIRDDPTGKDTPPVSCTSSCSRSNSTSAAGWRVSAWRAPSRSAPSTPSCLAGDVSGACGSIHHQTVAKFLLCTTSGCVDMLLSRVQERLISIIPYHRCLIEAYHGAES